MYGYVIETHLVHKIHARRPVSASGTDGSAVEPEGTADSQAARDLCDSDSVPWVENIADDSSHYPEPLSEDEMSISMSYPTPTSPFGEMRIEDGLEESNMSCTSSSMHGSILSSQMDVDSIGGSSMCVDEDLPVVDDSPKSLTHSFFSLAKEKVLKSKAKLSGGGPSGKNKGAEKRGIKDIDSDEASTSSRARGKERKTPILGAASIANIGIGPSTIATHKLNNSLLDNSFELNDKTSKTRFVKWTLMPNFSLKILDLFGIQSHVGKNQSIGERPTTPQTSRFTLRNVKDYLKHPN